MNPKFDRHDYIPLFLLLAFSLLGAVLILLCSRLGAGISTDSTTYIQSARNLMNGQGLSVFSASGNLVPMIHFPPLFPSLLALIGFFGVDPLVGARGLNALLFAANIMLVGFSTARFTHGSRIAVVFSSLILVTSWVMLKVHTMAWSEPLFIFLSFLGLLLLSIYLERKDRMFLISSSLAIALSFLCRYAAAPLILTGIFCILFFNNRRKLNKRITDSIVFTAFGVLPILLWSIRNIYISDSVISRRLLFHAVPSGEVKYFISGVSTWFLPWRYQSIYGTIGFILFLGILFYANKSLPARGERIRIISLANSKSAVLPNILITFVLFYIGFLVLTAVLFEAALFVDPTRILSPLYVAILMIILHQVYTLLLQRCDSRHIKGAIFSLCFVFLAFNVTRSFVQVRQYNSNGVGYASREWRDSDIIKEIKSLPSGIRIYSNGPDAIYILTGKYSFWMPWKYSTATLINNDRYDSELASIQSQLKDKKAVLVYFNKIDWIDNLPTEEELAETLRLRAKEKFVDGTIYTAQR